MSSDLLALSPEDYRVLGEEEFGVPGLVAHEIIGPFVRVQALGALIMVHDGRFEPGTASAITRTASTSGSSTSSRARSTTTTP